MMIKPTFEDPINTVEDYLLSPLDVMVLANTSIVKLLNMDQRQDLQKVWERTKLYRLTAENDLPRSVENG